MRRLEDDEKITPELRKKLRSLGDRYRFRERLSLVTDIAKKEYGEGYLDEIDSAMRLILENNFRKMIDALKQIDEDGTADLYIWNIRGWNLPYSYFNSAKDGDQRFDSKKVLEILKATPEYRKKVSHLEITAAKTKSGNESDFDRRMSSGEYGPRD